METTIENSLVTKDLKYIWHPFTQTQTAPDPIVIKGGNGSLLFSEDGRTILDGISSWWVNLHGHAHPYIAEKIYQQSLQLEHVIFADFTHKPAVEFAERLLPLLPGAMSKIFYTDNGSTAIEAALKIALQYWYNENQETSKQIVVALQGGYHGDTFGAMSVAGRGTLNKPFWPYLFDVETIPLPTPGQEENSFNALRHLAKSGRVAAFIFEPLILGMGGMIIYPEKALETLLSICQEYGIITIADEVMTGFGRTGKLFACDNLLYAPDMICLSKGITGGFLPLGVTACKQNIFERFTSQERAKAFLHGHSYCANPLACTAAIASLDLLETPSSQENRARISEQHANFCERVFPHAKLLRCESLGTILVIEYKSEKASSYFHPLRDRLYHFFLSNNILLRPFGNTVHVIPPYCTTRDQLEKIYLYIEKSLEIV